MKRALALFAPLAIASSIAVDARADFGTTFGASPRSAALANADVAHGSGLDARENAALASDPGLHARIGWSDASMHLRFDGADAGVEDPSGVSIAIQYGARVTSDVDVGLATNIYFPDRYLARIGFRPATEPQFVLYEAPLQRTTVDLVLALRVRAFSFGAGASLGLDVGGDGTDFRLAQDAKGTTADAKLDVTLPYRASPVVGARLDLNRLAVGLTFRGPLAISVEQDNIDRIDLASNPLNGSTTVVVRGQAGYDPARVDLGARVGSDRVGVSASLEYAFYRFTPPPVADVDIGVMLGTTPSLREARFPDPSFRDTLSPRVGVEATLPRTPLTLRVGYAYVPSPVPPQTSFTTYLDANRHVLALGAGARRGEVAGVELSFDAALQLHALVAKSETKPDPSLPYSTYSLSGWMLAPGFALSGAWR